MGLFRSRWFSLGWAVAVAAWRLRTGAFAIVGRVIAFGLVIAGAAVMPGPLRAGEAARREV